MFARTSLFSRPIHAAIKAKAPTLLQPFKRLGQLYMKALTKYPVRTNMASTFLIYSMGDMIAQRVEHEFSTHKDDDDAQELQINFRRVAYVGGFVLCLWAPAMSLWVPQLDRWFNPANRAFSHILRKVAFHQCTMPVVLNTSFMAWCTFFKQRSVEEIDATPSVTEAIQDKISSDFLSVTSRSILIFTPVNSAIFYLFPGPSRIVVMSFTNVFWNVYMSLIAHSTTSTDSSANDWADVSIEFPDLTTPTVLLLQ